MVAGTVNSAMSGSEGLNRAPAAADCVLRLSCAVASPVVVVGAGVGVGLGLVLGTGGVCFGCSLMQANWPTSSAGKRRVIDGEHILSPRPMSADIVTTCCD